MASITCSSDQRLSTSKRRLKPLMLRDYLLDDLSSCSSNGFKSFPRRQPPSSSSTVRRLLDAEIKRSGLSHHHKPRLARRNRTTCGTAISHAVHKASTAFLNAVKLIPFHSTVTSRKGDQKQQGVFSRSFSKRLLSKRFWRKPASQSRREVTVELGDGEIQWWISAAFFPDEKSLDQPSDLVSQISTVADEGATFSASDAAAVITIEKLISGADSSSSGSEFFTNSSPSENVQSSSSSSVSSTTLSGEAEEVSIGNDAEVESEESLSARDCDGSSVNGNSMCNREECVNEEKEQLSPVSILECPFQDDEDEDDDEDDAITDHTSHQNDTYENVARKSRRLNGFVCLEPLDLEKRIEKYVESEEDGYSYHTQETEEDESETRANRLFALVKSRIGETNNILLASNVADNLLLDYLQEANVWPKEEALMVKKVEDWVMDRQEEMFMSWEVREMRQVYVKEMIWGCINEDERESVVEDLANGFFTFLVDEFICDLAS